jgi:MFS family permease
MSQNPATAADPDAFPPGLNHAFSFATFNALSFQIMLGSPMILYARSLDASATVLGIIAGMMPLLVVFQIPAANHINRIGYRRFVLAGWTTRVMFIFGIALVPLTSGFLDAGNRLALLLALLFCFNLSRGISSCAWLPWITLLVPAELRGRYLARDAAVQNLARFIAFLIAALTLAGATHAWQFALLFAFSGMMGAISLVFLKRIPDVPIPETVRTSPEPVPWLAMTRYAPFRKLLHTLIAWSVVYGGINAFTVAFLNARSGLSEGQILLISSVAFIGGVSMANNKLAMSIAPAMGRNHFFAIFSVISNVTLGLSPIAWGLLIDAIGSRAPQLLGIEWNRFTLFFAGAGMAAAVMWGIVHRLEEPKAASMEALLREILIQSPQRFWLRFWTR